MSQLRLDIPDDVFQKVEQQARARGKSVSEYLAELVCRHVQAAWPNDFFTDVVGSWNGDPLERPEQGEYEKRDAQ